MILIAEAFNKTQESKKLVQIELWKEMYNEYSILYNHGHWNMALIWQSGISIGKLIKELDCDCKIINSKKDLKANHRTVSSGHYKKYL